MGLCRACVGTRTYFLIPPSRFSLCIGFGLLLRGMGLRGRDIEFLFVSQINRSLMVIGLTSIILSIIFKVLVFSLVSSSRHVDLKLRGPLNWFPSPWEG